MSDCARAKCKQGAVWVLPGLREETKLCERDAMKLAKGQTLVLTDGSLIDGYYKWAKGSPAILGTLHLREVFV